MKQASAFEHALAVELRSVDRSGANLYLDSAGKQQDQEDDQYQATNSADVNVLDQGSDQQDDQDRSY